jgi:hypothetical protein
LYRRQTRAVRLWAQARKYRESASPLYEDLLSRQDELTEDDRARLHANDPDAMYKTHLEPTTSLEDLTDAGALTRLRDSYFFLLALSRAYPPPGMDAADFADELAQEEALDMVDAAMPLPAALPRREASPTEIVAMVRNRDKWDFLLAFVLTSLAFLATIYVGKDFGSAWQYLTAFLAGATGQLVVTWALLPWYRSYRVASAPPAAAS